MPLYLRIGRLAITFGLVSIALAQTGYVNSEVCADCHAGIYKTYQRTGMARSFYRPQVANTLEDYSRNNHFHHAASDTYYSMSQRDGRYYQRRWQIGFHGKEDNVEEMQVDYVMGSGNHARTYLHRSTRGALIQLPLGWYAGNGGYWAMNPGYDSAHPPAQRTVAYECMFCHNAYPRIPAGHEDPESEPVYNGNLPEGIDCQRCHGPGAKHVTAARAQGAKPDGIRAAIVNPGRLSKVRQMEVCLQCHLETTSTRLPGLIRKFDKPPFSYLPGQPLGDFVLSFDHAPGSGREDKFEIAGSAYRLRKSQCFLKSDGGLTCRTCHDPHDVPRGEAAVTYYAGICRQCHALPKLSATGRHPAGADCTGCHMPKGRTDDAVHVVMTDHWIQRRPPARERLEPVAERHPAPRDEYHGEVMPYYPAPLAPAPDNVLYAAVAQVLHGSNLTQGIGRLAAELRRRPSPTAAFYMAMGDAWRRSGEPAKAAQAYGQAVRLKPDSARNLRYLGIAWKASAQAARAAGVLKRAAQLAPDDPQSWFELGLLASEEGRHNDATTHLRRALALDPAQPDAQNSLGVNLAATGDGVGAEAAFREALRLDPQFATGHGNLARLLSGKGDLAQAVYHFERAASLQPADAPTLYEYALTLVRMNRFEESERQARASVTAGPNLAEAHELLGGLLSRKGDPDGALPEFEAAVRLKPEFSRAQLDLGAALAAKGDMQRARRHLREAAKGSDPQVARQAAQVLARIGGRN